MASNRLTKSKILFKAYVNYIYLYLKLVYTKPRDRWTPLMYSSTVCFRFHQRIIALKSECVMCLGANVYSEIPSPITSPLTHKCTNVELATDNDSVEAFFPFFLFASIVARDTRLRYGYVKSCVVFMLLDEKKKVAHLRSLTFSLN